MNRSAIEVLLALSALGSLGSQSTIAEPAKSQCSGVLHRVNGDLLFGGGRGEGEGICVVNSTEIGKVMAMCQVGRPCTVQGTVDECKDEGECVEITNILLYTGDEALVPSGRA